MGLIALDPTIEMLITLDKAKACSRYNSKCLNAGPQGIQRMWTRKENMFREKVVQYGGAPSCEAKSAEKVVLYDGHYTSGRHGDCVRDGAEKLGNNNPTKGHHLRVNSKPSVLRPISIKVMQ